MEEIGGEYHTLKDLGVSENEELITAWIEKIWSKNEFESWLNRDVPLIRVKQEYKEKSWNMPKHLIINWCQAELMDILKSISDYQKK